MSISYRKREWSRVVGEGTETVSVAKQLELWADIMLFDAAKQGMNQEVKAITEHGAAVLAVGSEIVDQLSAISTTLEFILNAQNARHG